MTFFNKKEEVLDVKLTPHGRYLLSIGKLRPAYYCFIDDDVVYDSAAIGESEIQNQSRKRIVDETPKINTISSNIGVETALTSLGSEDSSLGSIRMERNVSKINRNYAYLGTNSYSSDRSATLQVSALTGEFASSAHYFTGSVNSDGGITQSEIINIPQLEMTPKYEIASYKLSFGEGVPTLFSGDTRLESVSAISEVFDDKTYFTITPENPLLFFKEFNSFNHMKNYEVEVYEITEAETDPNGTVGEVSYKPLKFRKNKKMVVNDMIVESNGIAIEEELTPDFVEYYFDILVDKEIPNEDICEATAQAEVRDIFIDEEIDCPEKATERFDIYGTKISDGDLERCD